MTSNNLDEVKLALVIYRDLLIRESAGYCDKIFKLICRIVLSEINNDYALIVIIWFIKNECLWSLINITFMTTNKEIFEFLAQVDFLKFYTKMLGKDEFKENLIILISNLVGGNRKSRIAILSTNIYEQFLNMMKEETSLNIFQLLIEFLIVLFQYSSMDEMHKHFLTSASRVYDTSILLKVLTTNMVERTLNSKVLECLVYFTLKFPIHNKIFLNQEFIDCLFLQMKTLNKNYTLKIIQNLTTGKTLIIYVNYS
jgi:hypothetical protein